MSTLAYQQTFQVPPEQLLALFCDRNFHPQIQAELGATAYRELDYKDDGTKFLLRCQYRLPATVAVPAFASKFMGAHIEMQHEERWDKETLSGQIRLQPKGLPGRIDCQARISPAAHRSSTREFDWSIKVDIPLLGNKLAKLIVEDIRCKADLDRAAVAAILKSAHPPAREFGSSGKTKARV